MAGIKISNLPAVGTPSTTDEFPIVQSNVTYKCTLQQALDLVIGPATLKVATTANLTATYNNGTSGIGATLTNSSTLAALTIDGVSVSVGDRVLVKNQSTQTQNGIYTVTTVGSGSVAWVLTRATDYDTPAQIQAGDFYTVASGTANAKTQWIQTQTITTVGSDNIIFESNVVAGTGLSKTNNTIALSTPVSLANGGTNKNITPDNGAIVYTDADSFELLASTATAGKVLQSGSSAAPSWSTPTYPSASGSAGVILRSNGTNNVYSTSTFADTYAINTILYAGSANTVSGLAPAASSVLISSSSNVPAWSGAMTNGQLIIGSTSSTPTIANLTAGTGITIDNGAGSITISSTGSGNSWTEVTGTSQAMSADNGYVANNAGLVTLTLPTTASFGTVISVIGKGAGGWKIAQNASQVIRIGSAASTAGVGGNIASTNQYDSINLICTVANTVWTAQGAPQGNITIV